MDKDTETTQLTSKWWKRVLNVDQKSGISDMVQQTWKEESEDPGSTLLI